MNLGGEISPGGLTLFVLSRVENSLPEVWNIGKRKVTQCVGCGLCYHIYGKENRNINWACPRRDH